MAERYNINREVRKMTKFELMSKKAEKQKELEELKLNTFVLNDKIKGIINEINLINQLLEEEKYED